MNQINMNLRPIMVGAVAVALDKYAIGETNLNSSLYFGVAVGVGVYASEYIAPYIAVDLPTPSSTLYNGKTLATRLIEISSSVGGAFLMNKYLLQNDLYRNEVFKKVGVIALSDVVGTYAAEYINGSAMTFLQ